MVTLFAIPKAFRGHTAIIQRNAITSWTLLRPRPHIILFGDDAGTAQLAQELGVTHIPTVARSEYGTPLVNDLFEQAQSRSDHAYQCYINADIILMQDFMDTFQKLAYTRGHFLMIGQRWDIDIDIPLDFSGSWQEQLREHVRAKGRLHAITGIDYFAFSRHLWDAIPPFAIGRTAWDNWLVGRARQRKATVVDVTPVVMAVHQNHDWSHLTGGMHEAWEGPEAIRNRDLAGRNIATLRDATFLFTPWGLIPRLHYHYARMKIYLLDWMRSTFPWLVPVKAFLRNLRGVR